MPFTEDLDQFFDIDEFASSATYTPAGGSAKTVPVIYQKEQRLITDDGAQYVDQAPSALCKSADVVGVRKGDALEVNGIVYTIHAYPDDGHGVITLELSR